MVAVLAGLVGVLIIALIGKLGQRFSDLTLVGYGGRLLGRPLGRLLGLLYAGILAMNASVDLRGALESVMGTFFFHTPVWVVIALMALTALSVSWFGIVNTARMAPVLSGCLVLFLIFGFIFLSSRMQIGYLRPLFDPTEAQVGSLTFWAALGTFRSGVCLLVLIPYTAEPVRSLRAYTQAHWVGWLGVMLAVLFPVVIFGPEGARHLSQPFPYVFATIRLHNLPLERLEVLIRLVTNLNALYAIAVTYFASGLLLSEVLETRRIRPCMIAITALSFLMAVMAKSFKVGDLWSEWALILTLLINVVVFTLLWMINYIK